MVLVLIGTQKQSFERLLRTVEHSKELENEHIIVQCGYTEYKSKKMEQFQFMSHDRIMQYIDEADFIICHGGVGTIFDCLHKGKKVLAMPRLEKYKEHVDDHQIEICRELQKEGYIEYCLDNEDFDSKIRLLKEKEYKKYVSNDNYLHILKEEI